MLKSIFPRSPSNLSKLQLHSDSFIKREFDAASSNAEKNRSIQVNMNKSRPSQTEVTSPRPNHKASSVRPTPTPPVTSPVYEEVDLNVAVPSSRNGVSTSSRVQIKRPDFSDEALNEEEPENHKQGDTRGISLAPLEDLFDQWTNIIKGAIFPQHEENKQTAGFETLVHNGNCLVLL
jgi:hypothetical protein